MTATTGKAHFDSIDSAELARCLFEESNDGLFIFDPRELRLVDANSAAQKLTRLPRGRLLRLSIPELFRSESPGARRDLLESCRLTQRPRSRETYRLVCDRHEAIEVSVSVSRLSTKPSALGVLAVREISHPARITADVHGTQALLQSSLGEQAAHLEAATAELRASELRMRELLNDVGAIVWEAEFPSWRFTYVSQQAEAILGYPVSQWLEEPDFWFKRIHPDDRASVLQTSRESFQRDAYHECDFRAIDADGRTLWLRNTVHVVSDSNGIPIKLRGVMIDVTGRVKANQFSAHLAAIVESTASAIISATLDGTVVSWNRGAQELFGYSADEAVGSSIMELIRTEQLKDARAVFDRVCRGEIVREHETVRDRKDGLAVEVSQTLAPIRDDNGNIIGISAVGRDITASRLAEHQLRNSELSLAKAQEIAQIGSWEYDLSTGQVTGSAEAHRIAGADEDQQHSFKLFLDEYIHPDDRMMIASTNVEALLGQAAPLEFRIMRPPEMEERYVRIQAELIDGSTVVGTLQDISDQKQADLELERARDELRASEAKYRTIVDTTREWIWELDVDGVFTFSNPAVESILGYTPEEIVGKSSLLMMDDQDRRQVEAKLPEMMNVGKGWSRWSIRWRHKDGSVRYLESSGVPMFDAAGELLGYRGSDRDITSRVQAEETARARERELAHVSRLSTMGEMTAGIAHEINQPLSAISNFAAAAQQRLKDSGIDSDAPIEDWLRQISQQAVRCGDIIHRLRRFAQKDVAVRSNVDVNSVMKDSIAILSGILREHSIKVDLQLPTQELSLLANETELQQVFVNLLRNGGDAMVDAQINQPRICIHATTKDDVLNVTIEDNGPGVDQGALGNLFDPFFTTREGGMGMGLAISRSIVENHGGRLCLDENARHGARFRIELPLQGAAEVSDQKRG